MEEAQQFEALRGLQNYLSVTEQVEDAELEIKRYEDKGFVKRMPWSQVTSTLQTQGTVSYAELGIISDASPWGVGAMLVFPSTGEPQVTILEALEAPVTREEAKMLGQEYGSSSSQAVMETFAVLR